MVKRRKRRSWSDDEKREIRQQTTVPGVSIAQLARRYEREPGSQLAEG